jgi:hypothetical protein
VVFFGALTFIALAEEAAMGVIIHQSSDQLSRALGEAVVKLWSRLPQDVQHDLFEETAALRGDAIRPQLAVFLHDNHIRTRASIEARAMLEPDSLGG